MGAELFLLVKVNTWLDTNPYSKSTGTNTSSLFFPGTHTITAAIIPGKSVAHKTSYEK